MGADGGMPTTAERADPRIPMQWTSAKPVYERKPGPCDIDGTNDRDRLHQLRYATALITFPVVGGDGGYTAATGARAYSDATDRYAARAARALGEMLNWQVRDRDAGTNLELGVVAL